MKNTPIDLEGLPLPPDAPGPGSCVRSERPEEGLVVLVLDPPHRKLAVIDLPLLRDLDLALGELERNGVPKGLVITGRAPLSFAAGADLAALETVTDPELVRRFVGFGHAVFARIAALGCRTVAAIGGPVPGGAYELALACDRIVAAEHPSTRIGLPETQLGILPAWGGSTRLPRRIGPAAALDAILAGKLYPAKAAKKRGMVDRLTWPEYLVRIAADVAMGREKLARPKRGLARWLVDKNPLVTRTIAGAAKKQVLAKTDGHYPAPIAALEIVARAAHTRAPKSFAAEAEAAARLATGPIAKNLISIFRGTERAKKLGDPGDGKRAEPPARVGVVGAGVMGAAIASLSAEKRMDARLFDLVPAALDKAVLAHRAQLDKLRSRKRLEPSEAVAAEARFEVTRARAGFGRCELVIEAVAEKLAVKREVLGQLAAQIPESALLATNTSSLSVDAIAEGLPHPGRVVGIHFFNPVRKMPLVEIVRGRHTTDAAVARAAAFALALGKTPVVCRDGAGFIVNRLLGPYLDEALRQFAGGMEPARIDRIAKGFGMPMGPLTLLDEVGFDIATHAAASLLEAFGARMAPSDALEPFLHAGRLGKKTKKGFYAHFEEGGRAKRELSPDLAHFAPEGPTAARDLDDQAMLDRMLLPMVNEAAFLLAEHIVDEPADLDLATVMGMGFPPFHGGLLRWADTLGPVEIVARLQRAAESPDVRERPQGAERFRPAPLLVEMAREGRGFHAKAAEPELVPATV